MADMAGDLAELKAAVRDLEIRMARLEARQLAPIVPPQRTRQTQGNLGLAAMNRIGAITLAIGIIFFFKYAVDENLIGAGFGVILGILFGFALIGSGDWLSRQGQRIFSQGIAGCGLATLYISLYASTSFYKLLPASVAFMALVGVCVLAIGLSIRYRNPAIAGLGFAGALLTPLLLHRPGTETAIDFAYLLVLEGTDIYIATSRRWPVLIPVVAPLAVLAAWILLEPRHPWALVFLLACFAAMHLAALSFSEKTTQTGTALYATGHACIVLAGLRIMDVSFSNRLLLRELDSLLLALYGIAQLAYALFRRSNLDRVIALVLIAIVIAKLYLYDVWQVDRFYRIVAFLVLGVLLLAGSWIYARSEKRSGAG